MELLSSYNSLTICLRSPWISGVSIWKSSRATQGEYLLWVSTTCRKSSSAEVVLFGQSLILKHPSLYRLKCWVFLWCTISVMLWYQGCCIQILSLSTLKQCFNKNTAKYTFHLNKQKSISSKLWLFLFHQCFYNSYCSADIPEFTT